MSPYQDKILLHQPYLYSRPGGKKDNVAKDAYAKLQCPIHDAKIVHVDFNVKVRPEGILVLHPLNDHYLRLNDFAAKLNLAVCSIKFQYFLDIHMATRMSGN